MMWIDVRIVRGVCNDGKKKRAAAAGIVKPLRVTWQGGLNSDQDLIQGCVYGKQQYNIVCKAPG